MQILFKILNPYVKAFFLLAFLAKITSLDALTYKYLNSSLAYNINWAKFWGLVKHRYESWTNVIDMLGLNLIALKDVENRSVYFKRIIGAVLILELAILTNYLVFQKALAINRLSPSMVFGEYFPMQHMFGAYSVKVASKNSFPSGHALVAVYWGLVSHYIMPKKYFPLIKLVALILCTSRLFTGAHWLSDVLATAAISIIWFQVYVNLRQAISGYKLSRFKNKYFK